MGAIFKVDSQAVQQLDFSDASALHCLLNLAGVHKSAPLIATKALLSASADPTIADDSGFTAVHYAAALSCMGAGLIMEALKTSPMMTADFWASLDFSKPRDLSNRKYLMRRG